MKFEETDQAREIWMHEQCGIIELMEKKGNMEDMYKIVKSHD